MHHRFFRQRLPLMMETKKKVAWDQRRTHPQVPTRCIQESTIGEAAMRAWAVNFQTAVTQIIRSETQQTQHQVNEFREEVENSLNQRDRDFNSLAGHLGTLTFAFSCCIGSESSIDDGDYETDPALLIYKPCELSRNQRIRLA